MNGNTNYFIEIKDAVNAVESSDALKQWKKSNPEGFLAYAQTFIDINNPRKEWYLGYYSGNVKRIATFTVSETSNVVLNAEDDNQIQDESLSILPIVLDDVRLSLKSVLESIAETHRKEYPRELQSEIIVNLQNSDGKTIWNISYFTRSFKVINFKVNPSDGKIFSHSINSIMDFAGN